MSEAESTRKIREVGETLVKVADALSRLPSDASRRRVLGAAKILLSGEQGEEEIRRLLAWIDAGASASPEAADATSGRA